MTFIRNDHSVTGSTRDRTLTMRPTGLPPPKRLAVKISSPQTNTFAMAASDFSREVPLLSLFIPFLNLEGHNLGKEVILSVMHVTEQDFKVTIDP